MARLIKGVIITDLRGKISGTTFQAGIHGLSIRHNRKRKQSITTIERRQLNFLAQLNDIWRTLNLTQKQNWRAWCEWTNQHSKHNDSIIISGLNGFLKLNLPRLYYGIAILTVPPLTNVFPAYSNMSLTVGSHNQLYLNSVVIVPLNNIVVVKISGIKESGCTISKNECKAIASVITNGSSWDIAADYFSLYGYVGFVGYSIGLVWSQIDLNSGLKLPETFKICQL